MVVRIRTIPLRSALAPPRVRHTAGLDEAAAATKSTSGTSTRGSAQQDVFARLVLPTDVRTQCAHPCRQFIMHYCDIYTYHTMPSIDDEGLCKVHRFFFFTHSSKLGCVRWPYVGEVLFVVNCFARREEPLGGGADVRRSARTPQGSGIVFSITKCPF